MCVRGVLLLYVCDDDDDDAEVMEDGGAEEQGLGNKKAQVGVAAVGGSRKLNVPGDGAVFVAVVVVWVCVY